MGDVGFGIVGTGWIAQVMADSIGRSGNARLAAVASRKRETAEAFAAQHDGIAAVAGIEALIARDDVDAVYIATPTAAKETIALAAIAAGKHVLVDKPLPGAAGTERMVTAAADKGVVFMDATHFVHHPRTQALRAAIPDKIGAPRSLVTTFYFPLDDPSNIRYDQSLEPMGAVGDMGWYCMRAVVEFLQPTGALRRVAAVAERHPGTGAVVRVSGLIAFEGGQTSTFDTGFTAGTAIMDLNLVGTKGLISLDDFVLNWANSFFFQNPDIQVGYVHRTGLATRKDFTFVKTPGDESPDVTMFDRFAELATSGDRPAREAFGTASLNTQKLVDAIWGEVHEG